MTQTRGMLTDRIKVKSKELLGHEITQVELRFMPYFQHVIMNTQKLDVSRINQKEREVMSKWREARYIEGGASQISITKEFYDALCEILFLGYVDLSK